MISCCLQWGFLVVLEKQLEFEARDVVTHLTRRTLHKVRAWHLQGAGHATVKAKFGAAHRINYHTRAIWRILDRQSEFKLKGHIAESLTLHADERDLIVVLPWHVVRGAYVNVTTCQSFIELTLHRLSFGYFLRMETFTLQHIQKVGVATGIELVGSLKTDAPVRKKTS